MIREQRIKSGKLLEVKFYPIFSDGTPMPRGPKKKESCKAKKEFNDRQAVKQFVRVINANFDEGDLFLHLTYKDGQAPETEAQAKRDVGNYIRRIKTYRQRELARVTALLKKDPGNAELKAQKKKLSRDLKYAYGTHIVEYKTGKRVGMKNYHFHLFLTGWGGTDRDVCETLWTKNGCCNADRFRPKTFGYEAAARYVCGGASGSRKFSCSKNLDKPIMEPPRDGRVSASEVERMVKQRSDDRAYWERRHKGYEFLGFENPPESCYNEYNGHYYLTVKLYRSDPPPKNGKTKKFQKPS